MNADGTGVIRRDRQSRNTTGSLPGGGDRRLIADGDLVAAQGLAYGSLAILSEACMARALAGHAPRSSSDCSSAESSLARGIAVKPNRGKK